MFIEHMEINTSRRLQSSRCAKFRTLRRSPKWTFVRWLEWSSTPQERFFFISGYASDAIALASW